MKRHNIKKTLGLFGVSSSLILANNILMPINSFANTVDSAISSNKMKIEYKYVTEDELTSEEKALINKALPKEKAGESSIYYMVYRPIKDSLSNIPKTGDSSYTEYLLLAGVSLLIIAISFDKKRKQKIASVLALTSFGTLVLSKEALAITNERLFNYNQVLELSLGEDLPSPRDIAGYTYVGYIRESMGATLLNNNVGNNISSMGLNSTTYENGFNSRQTSLNNSLSSNINPSRGNSSNSINNNSGSIDNSNNNLDKGSFITDDTKPATDSNANVSKEEDILSVRVIEKDVIRPYKDLDIIYLVDNSLAAGQTRRVEGRDGKDIIQYEVTYLNGIEISHIELSRNTIEAIATIIYLAPDNNIPVNPSKPEQATPSEPEQATPSEPEQANPSEPEQANPSEPEQANPSEPEQANPSEPKQPNPSEPTEPEEPQKVKPEIQVMSLIKDPEAKKVDVEYKIEDATTSLISAKLKVYLDGTLVKELALQPEAKTDTVSIEDLDLNTDYVLKTELEYDLGNGTSIEVDENNNKDFNIEFKRIEFKNVTSIDLYNGNDKITSLREVPNDLTNYRVVIKSENLKDVVLAVEEVEETEVNGTPVFKLIVHTEKLIKDNGNEYQRDYSFYVKKINPEANTYTDFATLINDIKANPSGTFILGADLNADDYNLPSSQKMYLDLEFTGKLLGQSENSSNQYAIYGLKAPLFKTVSGGTIKDIDLKDVNMDTRHTEVGVIADFGNSGTLVENVSITGNITAPRHIGGFFYKIKNNTKLSNVSFVGNINSNGTATNHIGGIVGHSERSTVIEKAKVEATINVNARGTDKKIGGIAGVVINNSTLKDSYAIGSINNAGNPTAQVGGVVGSTYNGGVVNNVITGMKVTNGNIVYGDKGFRNANVNNAYYIDNIASGEASTLNRQPQVLSEEAAREKIDSLGITTTTTDTDFNSGYGNTDYTSIKNYDVDRDNVYKNLEKIIPFYNKDLIVSYGNKVDTSDNFYTKKILSVVPMMGNVPLYDLKNNKTNVNKVLVNYTDGTNELLNLTHIGEFDTTGIEEYEIENKNLIYTPELKSYDYNIDSLVDEMASMDYTNTVRSVFPNLAYTWALKLNGALALGLNPRNGEAQNTAEEKLKENNADIFMLKDSFSEVKENLRKHIISMIENDNTIDNINGEEINSKLEYIRNNKEKIMLGLAYLNRWYDVNVGDVNIKDFTMYHQDIFGKKFSSIKLMEDIGSKNTALASYSTANTYRDIIAPNTGKADIFAYLESYKNIFDKDKTMNEWFKANTKADIYEAKPTMEELADLDIDVWTQLQRRNNDRNALHQNKVLVLLSMKHKGLVVISTMGTLAFVPYENYHRIPTNEYYDDKEAIINDMRARMVESGDFTRNNLEMWYRISPENTREKIYNDRLSPVVVWDGFSAAGGGWMLLLKEGEVNKTANNPWAGNGGISEFFRPLQKYFLPNGTGAYAEVGNGVVNYIVDHLLTKYGNAVLTHEVTHNLDKGIYLGGRGYRPGMGPEDYARGLLESVNNIETDEGFWMNSNIDYTTYNNGSMFAKRLHNASPERFSNADDLWEYWKGTYDVLYTLSYAEAEELIKLPKSDLRNIINKAEYAPTGTTENDTRDIVREYTDEEWNAINFNSINDLIDNNAVVARRGARNKVNQYDVERKFLANYGAYTIPDLGSPGSRTFKQMAFEMLGAAGYEGFLNYTTDKLVGEANGQFSDTYILNKTFNGRYSTYNDFRKDMYKQRMDKMTRLKPFVYKGNTYSSYNDLKTLMAEAIQKDVVVANRNPNRFDAPNVRALKVEIFRYYINLTDDFRTSIFED